MKIFVLFLTDKEGPFSANIGQHRKTGILKLNLNAERRAEQNEHFCFWSNGNCGFKRKNFELLIEKGKSLSLLVC